MSQSSRPAICTNSTKAGLEYSTAPHTEILPLTYPSPSPSSSSLLPSSLSRSSPMYESSLAAARLISLCICFSTRNILSLFATGPSGRPSSGLERSTINSTMKSQMPFSEISACARSPHLHSTLNSPSSPPPLPDGRPRLAPAPGPGAPDPVLSLSR